jgi:glycosyltransferase involved in cell wall biosynthesis
MISVVMPVFNEEVGIRSSIHELKSALQTFEKHEIILVNDGSTDSTMKQVESMDIAGIQIINHVENLGYGKSLFDGIKAAKYECIAILDGDGSYPAHRLIDLYSYWPNYDMVVGARQGREYQRGLFKRPARLIFKMMAEYAAGRKISDINSGMRVFRKSAVLKFQDSLCAGFSFTTTITLLFMLNNYFVKYVPVEYLKRSGTSKVRPFRDTLRSLQFIVQVILYYNPMKLFLLIGGLNALLGVIAGTTNAVLGGPVFISIAAALCIAGFVPIFSLGLIADQLRKLYRQSS